jgi:putative membrane protein
VYSFTWLSPAGYWALQLVMLGAAWQFSATWFAPDSAQRPMALVAAPALLAMAMGLVGALLTFAPRPLLAEHIWSSALVGVAPLRDQQLAGLVMWTGGMVPMALFAGLGLRNIIRRTGEGARC